MINIELRLLPGLNGGSRGTEKGPSVAAVEYGMTLDVFLGNAGLDTRGLLAVLINGRHGAGGTVLEDGDVVSVFPSVSLQGDI